MDNRVIYEDRTTESPERAMHRHLAGPASALVAQAIGMSQGNGSLATQLIAAALGQVVAGSGGSIDDVLALARQHHELAVAFIEEHGLRQRRTSDA